MAEQQTPSPELIPSTEVEKLNEPVDSIGRIPLDLDTRASTTTTVLQEILARGDDRYYAHHWGINE
jgi:hypothetical protein